MKNHGNFIVSLGQLNARLAEQAEAVGVDVFPGFAGAEAILEDDRVVGVRCGDMGLNPDGSEGPAFTPGVDIHAGVSVFAEGCRGSVSKQLIRRFGLDQGRSPQTYGLGFKELWQLPAGLSEIFFVLLFRGNRAFFPHFFLRLSCCFLPM